MNKKILRLAGNLITALLAVLMILTAYCAVTSRLSGGVPKIFGLQMYEVLSGSMEPGMQTGSVIFDKPGVDTKNLIVGDVITFKASEDPKMLITHRILQVKSAEGAPVFQTKGDANNAPDSKLVPAADVVAQYNNITIPYLGFYLNFMKSKAGIVLLIIVPGALLIISTMISLFREILRLKKAKKQDPVDMAPENTV